MSKTSSVLSVNNYSTYHLQYTAMHAINSFIKLWELNICVFGFSFTDVSVSSRFLILLLSFSLKGYVWNGHIFVDFTSVVDPTELKLAGFMPLSLCCGTDTATRDTEPTYQEIWLSKFWHTPSSRPYLQRLPLNRKPNRIRSASALRTTAAWMCNCLKKDAARLLLIWPSLCIFKQVLHKKLWCPNRVRTTPRVC